MQIARVEILLWSLSSQLPRSCSYGVLYECLASIFFQHWNRCHERTFSTCKDVPASYLNLEPSFLKTLLSDHTNGFRYLVRELISYSYIIAYMQFCVLQLLDSVRTARSLYRTTKTIPISKTLSPQVMKQIIFQSQLVVCLLDRSLGP